MFWWVLVIAWHQQATANADMVLRHILQRLEAFDKFKPVLHFQHKTTLPVSIFITLVWHPAEITEIGAIIWCAYRTTESILPHICKRFSTFQRRVCISRNNDIIITRKRWDNVISTLLLRYVLAGIYMPTYQGHSTTLDSLTVICILSMHNIYVYGTR